MGSSEQQIFTIAPFFFQNENTDETHIQTDRCVQYLSIFSAIAHIRANMHSRANCKMGLTKLGWHWRVESFYSSHQFFVGQRIVHLKQVKNLQENAQKYCYRHDIVDT
jgi:hypothetical protein